VLLTDRSPDEVLPALQTLDLDFKIEPLDAGSVANLADLSPSAVLIDAEENPEQAFVVMASLAKATLTVPVVVVLGRADLERATWADVADDMLFGAASAAEIRLRLAMVNRRSGGTGEAVLRLGPVAISTDTYQVVVAGRVLDLTYKEFELLRFLVQHPGRVFTRGDLLSRVWGFNFYGGTRTVDVHVRRLRAKLGPEHEALIQTVRGVGYRAAEPRRENL
jgi:DNA-binding response OmpR family regulator